MAKDNNKHMDLSVIIVSWNVRDLLRQCLNSLYKQAQGISLEIFVVDNASSDGSVGMIREEFPQAGLIANAENRGFAAANNQAIVEAKGDFVLLLNPDTEIKGDALEKMVCFMREHKDCGVAGCKLLNSDGTLQPSVRRFPALASQALVLMKLHHFLPNLKPLRKYFARDFDYSKTQEADQVMGAFFMISREALDKIGPLDESYFIWFEEVDFCRKAKNAGLKVMYVAEAEIIHHESRSFRQVLSFRKQRIFNKSLLCYFKKHQPFFSYAILRILSPISLLLALMAQVFMGGKRRK